LGAEAREDRIDGMVLLKQMYELRVGKYSGHVGDLQCQCFGFGRKQAIVIPGLT
jgi:hypothetical protein